MENQPEESSELLQRTQNQVQPREMAKPTDTFLLLRKRYYVVLAIWISWIILAMLRINLSICLIQMTSNRTIEGGNKTYIKEPEFHWTSIEKGIILSSFSWGFLCSPIGSILAAKFGAVRLFGLGLMGTAILTISTPMLIRKHVFIYLAGRFLEGVGESICAATESSIFFYWAPVSERTLVANTDYLGFTSGIIISYPFVAYLSETMDWENTFYITGGIGVFWSLLWLVMIRESPAEDKFMLETERNYLKQTVEAPRDEKIDYPYTKILTSKPVWAFWNERFVEAWSISFYTTCLPLYLKDVLDVNIEEIGWIGSIPFCFEFTARIPGALIADYLRRKKIMSTTAIHKTYILLAQIGGLVFLLVIAFSRHYWLCLIALALSRSIFSLGSISYNVLPLDLGSQYGSFIMGVSMTTLAAGYILNPIVIGLMITNESAAEWGRYFIFLCCFNAWAVIIFAIYGSGELQSWAHQPRTT